MSSTLRHSFRSLAKSPGFTLVALVTLTVGLGLNTAMFSLLNALMLRPLAFHNSAQLVQLHRSTSQEPRGALSPADYLDLERDGTGFGQFAAYAFASLSLAEPGHAAEMENALRVSADFFNVLEVQPQLGRTFRPEEETQGNHRIVVISYALWQNRFAGAADIIGRTIRLNAEPHEIIGVLPASAYDRRLFGQIGVYRPLGLSPEERANRNSHELNVIGRRGASLSAAQGEAFISAFGARLAKNFPVENGNAGWRSEKLLNSTMNPVGRAIVAMLLGLSGFVLLIACSNLANLLLARALARSREFAVRAALGASRWRLVLPLAWEAILLAAAGGGGAVLVSAWTLDWVSAHSVANGGEPLQAELDARVIVFALGAATLTALIFGVVPALFATRIDLNDTLKSGARGATPGRGHRRIRQGLIVGQFTMAMVLLAGAGFFLRGAKNVFEKQVGWNSSSVIQAAFVLPVGTYRNNNDITAFQRQAIERLQALPGVEAASVSYALPYSGLAGARQYLVENLPAPAKGQEPSAQFNGVTPEYFHVTGTRILKGRAFNPNDTAASPRVVIISENMAHALFQEGNPIGHRIAQAGTATPTWAEIVGLAADVRSTDLSSRNPFQVYHPSAQEPWPQGVLAVRANGVAPAALVDSVRNTITALDPDLPLRDVMPVETAISRQSSDLVLINRLLLAFALLGLFLAALGIYGVIARTVVQQTAEIGLRMALGAQASDVIRMILNSGIRLALAGTALGLIGAFGLLRVLASGLPAMQTNGVPVLAAAVVVLIAIALLACWLPARRAAKVDPLTALRSE